MSLSPLEALLTVIGSQRWSNIQGICKGVLLLNLLPPNVTALFSSTHEHVQGLVQVFVQLVEMGCVDGGVE